MVNKFKIKNLKLIFLNVLKISLFLLFITSYQLPVTSYQSFAQHEGHNPEGSGLASDSQSHKMQTETKKEAKEQRPQKKKAMYHCPMHPTYISDKPGDCPICNMKLVLMEERAEQEKPSEIVPEGAVMITPEKQQLIGVKTEAVLKRHLTRMIRTVGKIAFDPELYKAEQEFIEANKTLKEVEKSGVSEVIERSKALVEASRLKLRLNGLGDEQINNLINTTNADRGLLISDEKTPYVWVYITIYEYEMSLVKAGQAIEVQAASHPGETFKGEIKAIDSVLDETTRSVRVRALIDNREGKLKPNMYADVMINVDLGEKLAIPEEAVIYTGERKIVFVAKPNGYFEPRNVRLGNKAEGYYEVLDGVIEKEDVVTSGNFLIDSESKLKSAISSGTHQHGQ